jgi:GNAT superfamily N-acetyltransferase
MKYMIRPATAADADGISRLLAQLEYPGTEDFIASRLETMLADAAEALLVWAEPPAAPESADPPNADAILAVLSLHFIPQLALKGDFARISYFAVDGNARSRGIGSLLEAEATRLARERGCALLEVHCHTRRTRAHEFYARQGFEESPKYLIKRL